MFPHEVGRPISEVTAFHPKPGGAPANVAVAAARLGARSAFLGKVGEDAFGHKLIAVLRAEGVEVRGLRIDPEARTTLAFIAMPDPHHAQFVFYRNPGADTRIGPDELDRELLSQARAFHFGSLSLTHEPARSATIEAVRIAKERGTLISFDVNYRPSLWNSPEEAVERIASAVPLADVLKVNETELELLSGTCELAAGAQALLLWGPTLCVVTLGAEGSYFAVAGSGERVPGFQVDTMDATGCGDAFVAGLLTQLTQDGHWRAKLVPGTLRSLLRYANAVGALTAQTLGVIPALPSAQRVAAFLTEHPN
jgi:fructokinase